MNDIQLLLTHLTPIRILITVFALFAWSRVFLSYRAKLFNAKELLFWSIVWLFAVVIVFIPRKTDILAHFLGIGSGFDALVFIAIILIYYVVYRLYAKANENEEIITNLVRKIALKNIKKRK